MLATGRGHHCGPIFLASGLLAAYLLTWSLNCSNSKIRNSPRNFFSSTVNKQTMHIFYSIHTTSWTVKIVESNFADPMCFPIVLLESGTYERVYCLLDFVHNITRYMSEILIEIRKFTLKWCYIGGSRQNYQPWAAGHLDLIVHCVRPKFVLVQNHK